MSDWFLADVDEAESVAGVAAGDHSFDEWPHLSVPLRRTELAALYAALTDIPADDPRRPAGLLAVEADSGMIVTRVPEAAVAALAELTPRTAAPVMAAWSESIGHGEPAALGETLSELAAFARDSAASGRPVLQLAPF